MKKDMKKVMGYARGDVVTLGGVGGGHAGKKSLMVFQTKGGWTFRVNRTVKTRNPNRNLNRNESHGNLLRKWAAV